MVIHRPNPKRLLKRRAYFFAILASVSTSALAQQAVPSQNKALDENGVDRIDGSFNFELVEGSIGTAESGLTMRRFFGISGWSDNWQAVFLTIEMSGNVKTATAVLGDRSEKFIWNGGVWVADQENGSTLTFGAVSEGYRYQSSDGRVLQYATVYDHGGLPGLCSSAAENDCKTIAKQLTEANGYTVNWFWNIQSGGALRLTQVTNSGGYTFTVGYASEVTNDPNWSRRTNVQFNNINRPISSPPTIIYAYPNENTVSVTDPASRTWRFTTVSTGGGYTIFPLRTFLTGIRRPNALTTNDTTSISYRTDILGFPIDVGSVVSEGVTVNYTNGYIDGVGLGSSAANAQGVNSVGYDYGARRPSSSTDALGRTTRYQYDTEQRPTRITMPEGNKVQYAYDVRGNVIETRLISKTPGTPPDIVTTAIYPPICVDPKTCNRPTSTTDAKGNVTDYSYTSSSGQIVQVLRPPPVSGAVRPATRYSYTSQNGVSLLTGISACGSNASCAGNIDEVKTTIDHDANLQPIAATTGSGDGVLMTTVASTYDAIGNRTHVDGPLLGTADTTQSLYDAARQLVGVIGPDPDGEGPLKNRAARLNYNADGQITLGEAGVTNGQSDAEWAAFQAIERTVSTYDANARKTVDSVQGTDGTPYALTQYSYDVLGRTECSAVRMNRVTFGSLSGSACNLGPPGADGQDRITKVAYNAAGQVVAVTSGYGTPDQADDRRTISFTLNGNPNSVLDANGNATTYSYDGYDRVMQVNMPSVTTVGGVSATDYEAYFYDPNGNVTQRRLRDGQIINYGFDNLDRLTLSDVPNQIYHDLDTTFSYDNFSRMTDFSNIGGRFGSLSYDALGRITQETSLAGTKSMSYDLAGRLTRLTHPDGFYVDYDRLVTGEVGAIRENGATSGPGALANFSYDNLGRRVTLTRGNGTSTASSYDPVSRLTNLAHDLAGTASDVLTILTYSPANQIASLTRSNDTYGFRRYYNVTRPYTVNGLNQLTSAGAVALGYDGRGNLTSSAANTYSYTVENRMATAPGQLLAYEPLGRLSQISSGSGGGTSFDYVGHSLLTERNPLSNSVQRRYVYDPDSPDAPLVWYEGTGTSDRRWLHADERGSVVAVSDSGGAVIATNSYDEHGIPSFGNIGRFGFTGQAWLPELGMWYYKARIYSATLGRFMQTDPIGYAGGMNLYAYTSGDPINHTDPLGLLGLPNGGGIDENDGTSHGDTIVVTGIRTPEIRFGFGTAVVAAIPSLTLAPFATINPLARARLQRGHRYRTNNKVCGRALTSRQRAGLLSLGAVPGHTSPVTKDGTYVAAPYGIPGGFVTTTFSPDHNRVVNVTTSFHAFVGSITRTIYSNSSGTFVETIGVGSAGDNVIGNIRDSINEAAGPKIFSDIDRTLADYARGTFVSC